MNLYAIYRGNSADTTLMGVYFDKGVKTPIDERVFDVVKTNRFFECGEQEEPVDPVSTAPEPIEDIDEGLIEDDLEEPEGDDDADDSDEG